MHVPPSYIYIYIFKKAVLSFPKAFNAQGSWSTKFCVYFGEEEKEDLWGKETSAKRLGSFVDGSNGCRLKASNHLGKYSRANASSACGFLPHWSMEDVWVIGVLIGVPLPRILSQDRYHLLLCSPTLFGAYCASRVTSLWSMFLDAVNANKITRRKWEIPNVRERRKFWQFFINIDGRLKLHEEKKKRIRGRQITFY